MWIKNITLQGVYKSIGSPRKNITKLVTPEKKKSDRERTTLRTKVKKEA